MADPSIAATLARLSKNDENLVSDEELQALIAAAVHRYAFRAAERRLDIFPPNAGITATECMLTVTAMLKAVDVQLFELGIWQTFSGARAG